MNQYSFVLALFQHTQQLEDGCSFRFLISPIDRGETNVKCPLKGVSESMKLFLVRLERLAGSLPNPYDQLEFLFWMATSLKFQSYLQGGDSLALTFSICTSYNNFPADRSLEIENSNNANIVKMKRRALDYGWDPLKGFFFNFSKPPMLSTRSMLWKYSYS